ncbi:protein of unknown function [Moritella yayanosii]|uniref:Uncharacterized protein n=1 Tax=Moritella yayanosii TaxID=69539 RepID=A0A330LPP3_9GAMM|nr:protein of unknown function [Moritella yayanosii]
MIKISVLLALYQMFDIYIQATSKYTINNLKIVNRVYAIKTKCC